MSNRGYSVVGLSQPKNILNVGNVLRAAHCFGAAMVVYTGDRFKTVRTDTPKAWKHMPLLRVEDLRAFTPFDCVPVAVDLVKNAISLVDFVHPERAFYVFGPEDGTLDDECLGWCKGNRVMIPTRNCLNLAAAVNVVLYDRVAKRSPPHA